VREEKFISPPFNKKNEMRASALLLLLLWAAGGCLAGGEKGTGDLEEGDGMTIRVSSDAFGNGETIPARHTCDGPDLSPALSWEGVPEGTETLALIVDDPDAPVGVFTHWVLFDLPGDAKGLPEGVPREERLGNGGIQGRNDFGKIGYNGPCPPPGRPHTYRFRLYALDTRLGLSPGATKADLLRAMEGHVLGKGELTGKYGR
jgi:hypothetical protein